MPKGRRFAPETGRDGVWYHHRGLPDAGPLLRTECTSMGSMMTAPFNPAVNTYPPAPPRPYQHKDTKNFKSANCFSTHDNRNSFQDHGVYFGNGPDGRLLGKRFHDIDGRQHQTGHDFLTHHGKQMTDPDYGTNYSSNYKGQRSKTTGYKRRFPAVHPEGKSGLADIETTPVKWFREPDDPFNTPLQVLAVSQEPFLAHNAWKYSYHGLSKCYPPYDKTDPDHPFSVWNVKGTTCTTKSRSAGIQPKNEQVPMVEIN